MFIRKDLLTEAFNLCYRNPDKFYKLFNIEDLLKSEMLPLVKDLCVEVNLETAKPVIESMSIAGFDQYFIDGTKSANSTGYNLYFKRRRI